MSIDTKVTDTELYNRAANNQSAVDVEIPFARATDGTGTITDGVIIKLNDCTVTSSPIPNNPEGSLETTTDLLPLSTEIQIRTPINN